MKKLTAIILLIPICTLILAGCNTNAPPKAEYKNDRYIYETIILADSGYNVIVEFDIISKSARIPCPDPLCEHGDDCLVSHIPSSVQTSKNRAYFKKNDCYYVINSAKNRITELFDSSYSHVSCPYQGPGSTVYFVTREYEYSDIGEITRTVYNVFKYDEEKETLTKLTEEPLHEEISFTIYKENTIVWYFPSAKGYYSTDLDFKNKQPYTAPTDEVSFKLENAVYPYGGNAFNLYMINTSGEKTLVLEKFSTLRFADYDTKDAIFYFPAKLVQSGVDEKTGKPIFFYTQDSDKLIYKNIYDESDTYAWEFSKGEMVYTASCYTYNNHSVGDYVAFPYAQSRVDENGNLELRAGIFVVNIKTKESFGIVYGNENTRVVW